jgi:benzoate-CoA ligase
VAQAVVVAAHDAEGLEKPVAYIILQPGRSASEDELIEFCRAALPSFKRPRKVVFVEAYPTTATGKVRRVELRAMASAALVTSEVPVVPAGTVAPAEAVTSAEKAERQG